MESVIQIAQNVLKIESKALDQLAQSLDGPFETAVDLIMHTTGRVIVSGMGKSGHVGRKIAATLASTGTPAFFVHPGEASHGDLGMLMAGDILLAISNSGEVKELNDILHFAHRFGLKIIAITRNHNSMLGRAADIVLKLPDNHQAPEACPFGRAPTTSTTLTLALGDALAVALMRLKGFTEEAYHARHPGGKLGAQLARVDEIMAKGDEVPLVKTGTLMPEALIEMTEKSLGILGVVDDKGFLIGAISDGDLRRNMADNLLNKRVDDVMSSRPKTIAGDVLAIKAVNMMNNAKITKIFVLDDMGRPVGCLSIHHCLTAGVI